jgi:aminoglycoside/choline kinase family phosphotransferase
LKGAFNAARRHKIASTDSKTDSRREALLQWLANIDDLDPASLTSASEDASFRHYYRLEYDRGTRIVMDAPPDQEDCGPFIKVAGFLEHMGLNSPRVLSADLEQGFLLLNDLGSTLYLTELQNDRSCADRLYGDAISALARMQKFGREFQSELPPYDEALLTFELSLFHDWLCECHLNITFSPSYERKWQQLCRQLVDNAQQQPKVFVHRDFHSRNLMVSDENNPGILDFQDAVEGPLTYDLVSLLKDCYVSWPDERVRIWAMQFYDQLDEAVRKRTSQIEFLRRFDLMGVQRHLKAAGIFARLKHRDGKPGYLADVPRTLNYIVALGKTYDELEFLIDLIRDRCFPKLEDST